MKKIITIIATFLVLSNSFCYVAAQDGPVNGDENDTNNYIYVEQDYESIAHDESLPDHLYMDEKPRMLLTRSRNASVTQEAWAADGLGFYHQEDYGHVPCGTSSNLAKVGCTITGLAIILNRYGVKKDPEQVFYSLKNNNGMNGCEVIWSKIGPTFGVKSEHWLNDASGFKEAAGLDIIEGVLRTGHPVLVGMRGTSSNPLGKGASHYVVIYGFEHYSDGGEFHYMRNTARDAKYQDTLQQYMAGPWYIYDFTKISY